MCYFPIKGGKLPLASSQILENEILYAVPQGEGVITVFKSQSEAGWRIRTVVISSNLWAAHTAVSLNIVLVILIAALISYILCHRAAQDTSCYQFDESYQIVCIWFLLVCCVKTK